MLTAERQTGQQMLDSTTARFHVPSVPTPAAVHGHCASERFQAHEHLQAYLMPLRIHPAAELGLAVIACRSRSLFCCLFNCSEAVITKCIALIRQCVAR
jgi:hypothetical protein